MPRGKRKTTPTGQPAQSPMKSTPGVAYGEGVQLGAMQRALPSVDAQAATQQHLANLPAAAAPTAGGVPTDVAQLLAQAPVGLLAGTQRPGEPVTAGLSLGPGPGPDALGPMRATTPLARMLRTLSDQSGDPQFAALADRAGL